MQEDAGPVLSIIIVSYNVRADIARCLDTLVPVRAYVPTEVIVIDNASTDGSVSFIRDRYPWTVTLANTDNIGFAAAVNQGITQARGDYLLLLNPDTAVCAGSVERMLTFMQSHPTCGIAGGHLLNEDRTPQESVRVFPSPRALLAESFFPKKLRSSFAQRSEPYEVDAVVGACLMARRLMIQEIGLLDERFFMYSEEVDWCLRAHQHGWTVYALPDAPVVHGLGRSSVDRPGEAFVELYRSRATYIRKHFNPVCRWVTHGGLFTGVVLRVILWGIIRPFTTHKSMRSVRKKYSQNRAVFRWYLRGCPDPHPSNNSHASTDSPTCLK